MQATRERETTFASADQYARRAWIEGTLALGVRVFDLRRSRYLAAVKTHLHAARLLIAMAINLVRIGRWLADEPVAQDRTSALERLRSLATPLAA